MRKDFNSLFSLITRILFWVVSCSTCLLAQQPNSATKIIQDCEYTIVPELATITSIQLKIEKQKSIFKYDEHEVLFTFQPMQGNQLIPALQDQPIAFVLRAGALRVPIGPKYIEQFHVQEGSKYAMNILQTEDATCLETFRYESKALPNDLFEAGLDIPFYTIRSEFDTIKPNK